MKEKKKVSSFTVIATAIGAIIWIVVSVCHMQILADTAVLALMIAFAAAWSAGAVIRIVQYLKQRKSVE